MPNTILATPTPDQIKLELLRQHFPQAVETDAQGRIRINAAALQIAIDGETYEFEAEGLLAICVQHEMDHLMGKVFVEYLSPLKRNRIRSKMIKRLREDEDEA